MPAGPEFASKAWAFASKACAAAALLQSLVVPVLELVQRLDNQK